MAHQESYGCFLEMIMNIELHELLTSGNKPNSRVSKAEEPESVARGNCNLPLPVDRFSGHTQIPVRLSSNIHLFKNDSPDSSPTGTG